MPRAMRAYFPGCGKGASENCEAKIPKTLTACRRNDARVGEALAAYYNLDCGDRVV
jgi:hypothetical protein